MAELYKNQKMVKGSPRAGEVVGRGRCRVRRPERNYGYWLNLETCKHSVILLGLTKYPFILAILLTIGDTLICSVTVSAEIREPLSRRLECRSKVQRGGEDSGWGHLSLSLPRFCGTIWD